MSLIEEGTATKKVRMANLAVVGSHSTNGVAEIHSKLLRETTSKTWQRFFPNASTTRRMESHPGAGCSYAIPLLPH